MIERQVEIETPDGTMTTFIFHPEEDGPHPIVLYLMDAPSIRPALKEMASRLATAGYYVMLPFLYYRKTPYREFGSSDEDMHERRELMMSVNGEGIIPDAEALLGFAADDNHANSGGKVGAVGFCMSGSLVLALAQTMPDTISAIASIHGAWLVTDKDNSPHLQVNNIAAEVYFGWADDDPTAPLDDLEKMDKALKDAGVNYRIDFMTGAEHGFAPPGGPRHHHYAAEKHWERVHGLLKRNIG